jgi:hypothetical protein
VHKRQKLWATLYGLAARDFTDARGTSYQLYLKPGECVVNDETDLRKAIAYLQDLDAELEERSAVRGLRANSAARKHMLYQLDHARKLVAALERHASNISCISYHNGGEMLIDLHKARTWCHLVEARIMRVTGGETVAG